MAFQALRSLWDLLSGGLMVALPVDADRPEGPALIRTVIQIDGDILNVLSPALLAKPPDAIAADLDRQHAAVKAAVKPLGTLKFWVEQAGVLIAAIGAGTALASAARTVIAPAGVADTAPVFGLGALLVAMGFGVPMLSGGLLRLGVGVALRLARTRLVARLLGSG